MTNQSAGDDAQRMTDSDLLQLCELPADVPEDVVELLRLSAALVGRMGDGPAGAAVALAVAMGRAGWRVQSRPFGYSGPRVEHEGWVERDSLAVMLAQLGGLIVGGRFNANSANVAIVKALNNYWLREQSFDNWEPGMQSGSGWTDVVKALPVGIARAWELITSPSALPVKVHTLQPTTNPQDKPDDVTAKMSQSSGFTLSTLADKQEDGKGPANPNPDNEIDLHAPYLPATWFSSKYGIPADRLRAARRDGRLQAVKEGKLYRYSVPDTQRLWPEDNIETPDTSG